MTRALRDRRHDQPRRRGRVWPVILWACALSGAVAAQQAAADPLLTPKEPVPALAEARTILVDVTALGNTGSPDPAPLVAVLARRFSEVGFSVVTDSSQDHDVSVKMVCRESSPATQAPSSPGRQTSPAPSGASHGAPCLIRYAYQGTTMRWQRVDRVIFSMGVEAARQVAIEESGLGPMETFTLFLERFDYPVLLTAEWGQTGRLRSLLESQETGLSRKRTIMFLLGEIQADDAVPCLVEALEDGALVAPAALALGNFGARVRPPLVTLLRTSPRSDVQAAAARSLGRIGATTGDWSLTPLFIEMLKRPDLDIAVQIELVWALGKNPDRQALPILEQLYDRVWSVRSEDPQMEELRRAIDWSHRSVRLGGHTDAY